MAFTNRVEMYVLQCEGQFEDTAASVTITEGFNFVLGFD